MRDNVWHQMDKISRWVFSFRIQLTCACAERDASAVCAEAVNEPVPEYEPCTCD